MADPKEWPYLNYEHRRRIKDIILTTPPEHVIPYDFTNPSKDELQKWEQYESTIRKSVRCLYPKSPAMQEQLLEVALARLEEAWREGIFGVGGQLSPWNKNVLDRWQQQWKDKDFFSGAGGYYDQWINCRERYIVHETISWLEQKYGALADMNRAAQQYGYPPIRFCGEDLPDALAETSMGGITYDLGIHQKSLAQYYHDYQYAESNLKLVGPVKGKDPIQDHTLVEHNYAHEYGHVIAFAITHHFVNQLKGQLGLDSIAHFRMCRHFIERKIVEKLKQGAKKRLGWIPKCSWRETDRDKILEGMSDYGTEHPAEFVAEVFAHTQCALTDNIRLNAYGEALNELLKDGIPKLAENLAKEVNTPQGWKEFKAHLEYWNRGYYGTLEKIPPAIWAPFARVLQGIPQEQKKSMKDAVEEKILRSLRFSASIEEATEKVNNLLQVLACTKICNNCLFDIESIYDETASRLQQNNPQYQLLADQYENEVVWTQVLSQLKEETKNLKSHVRVKTITLPNVALLQVQVKEISFPPQEARQRLSPLAEIQAQGSNCVPLTQLTQSKPSLQVLRQPENRQGQCTVRKVVTCVTRDGKRVVLNDKKEEQAMKAK